MSTEIKTILGSYHHKVKSDFSVEYKTAELSITRFYNGKDKGSNIQLTIQQLEATKYSTSYIHLSKEQCEELAYTLLSAFDYEKYPSE